MRFLALLFEGPVFYSMTCTSRLNKSKMPGKVGTGRISQGAFAFLVARRTAQ